MAITRKKASTKAADDASTTSAPATKAATKKAPAKKAATKKAPAKKAATKKAPAKKPGTPVKNVTAARAATKKTPAKKAPAKKAAPAKAAALSESAKVALAVAEAALDKKAVNVVIIDGSTKFDYADYVVVMSGTSDRQVNALARGIMGDVEKKTRAKCISVEGTEGGAWVLMDFGDVIVHIFHQDVRGFYDLESLWIDAARLPVPGEPGTSR